LRASSLSLPYHFRKLSAKGFYPLNAYKKGKNNRYYIEKELIEEKKIFSLQEELENEKHLNYLNF